MGKTPTEESPPAEARADEDAPVRARISHLEEEIDEWRRDFSSRLTTLQETLEERVKQARVQPIREVQMPPPPPEHNPEDDEEPEEDDDPPPTDTPPPGSPGRTRSNPLDPINQPGGSETPIRGRLVKRAHSPRLRLQN